MTVRGNEGKHEGDRHDHKENVAASSDQSRCSSYIQRFSNASTQSTVANSDL